jgi:putative oxidoreductase
MNAAGLLFQQERVPGMRAILTRIGSQKGNIMNTTITGNKPNTTVTDNNLDDIGKLALRAVLSFLILFHGVSKLIGGAGFITGLVAKAGLPAGLGYLVYVGEVLAPLLLLFGIWARIGALIIVGNMIVAILLAHTGDLFKINQTGGWQVELQAMFLVAAVAVALLGAGRYSVQGKQNRWN